MILFGSRGISLNAHDRADPRGSRPTWLVAVKASGAGGIIFADCKTGRNRFRPSCLRRGAKQAPTSLGVRRGGVYRRERWRSRSAVTKAASEKELDYRKDCQHRKPPSDRKFQNEPNFRPGAGAQYIGGPQFTARSSSPSTRCRR